MNDNYADDDDDDDDDDDEDDDDDDDNDEDDDDAKSYSKKAMNGKIQGGVEPHLKQPIVDWPR